MSNRVLGVVTARAGSKGIPGKNTKLLGGKPLILYTIESALAEHHQVSVCELRERIWTTVAPMIDAMPEETEAQVHVSARVTEAGRWVEVAVRDNGPGIPADIAESVFEPFFTTKKEGTGLGLAMIYAFVQRFSGRVTLETTPGKGSTFTLWFPER